MKKDSKNERKSEVHTEGTTHRKKNNTTKQINNWMNNDLKQYIKTEITRQ